MSNRQSPLFDILHQIREALPNYIRIDSAPIWMREECSLVGLEVSITGKRGDLVELSITLHDLSKNLDQIVETSGFKNFAELHKYLTTS